MRGVSLLLVVLAASVARAQQPSPIPAELLSGKRLVLKEANCSIEAPESDDWEWTQVQNGGNGDFAERDFICKNSSSGEVFLLGVYTFVKTPRDRITLEGATRIATNIAKGGEKSGFTTTGLACQPDDAPRRGQSYAYTFGLIGRGGQGVRMSGRITDLPDDTYRVFVVGRVSQDPSESVAFSRFVGSFKVLKEPAPRPSMTVTPALLGVGYFVWLGLCLLVAAVVNAIVKKPLVNGGTVACVLIMIFMLLNMGGVVLLATKGSAPGDSNKVAELLGEHIGAALIPLIIGAYCSQRFNKSAKSS